MLRITLPLFLLALPLTGSAPLPAQEVPALPPASATPAGSTTRTAGIPAGELFQALDTNDDDQIDATDELGPEILEKLRQHDAKLADTLDEKTFVKALDEIRNLRATTPAPTTDGAPSNKLDANDDGEITFDEVTGAKLQDALEPLFPNRQPIVVAERATLADSASDPSALFGRLAPPNAETIGEADDEEVGLVSALLGLEADATAANDRPTTLTRERFVDLVTRLRARTAAATPDKSSAGPQAVFAKYDTNRDGVLVHAELKDANVPTEVLGVLFNGDENAKLTLDQFVQRLPGGAAVPSN
jgi:hypothetical protein